MFLFAVLVSILAGGLIVFTRIFNFKMADKMGLFEGAAINYIAGLIFSILLVVVYKGDLIPDLSGIPQWAFLGGLLGVGIVVLSSYLTSRVSSFYLTLLIFLGQLVTGIVIDYLLIGDLSITKLIGAVLVFIGFGYNLRVDAKETPVGEIAA